MKPVLPAVLDGSAVGLSALCLAHCLLLPVAAALLPALGAWAEADWVHPLFVAIAAPVAGAAFLRGESGRPRAMLLLAAAGLSLLLGALVAPHAWEAPITTAGGLALASAHLWNWRWRHRARTCGPG